MIRSTGFHGSKHLGQSELLEPAASCPWCGNDAPRRSVVRIQSDPDVQLLRCDQCLADSASRMPRPEVLAAYYAAYYDPGAPRATFAGVGRFADHLVRYARIAGRRRMRLLDFGGGDGSIAVAVAERLLRAGAERVAVEVVDVGEPQRTESHAGGSITTTFGPAVDQGADCDLVIASAILEHLPEPAPVLTSLFGRLAHGGTFYARTPWIAPLAERTGRVDLCYPGHVHDLGAGFWNRLPARAGLDVEVLRSRPSIVENDLSSSPMRALAASMLKAPAHAVVAIRGEGTDPLWPIVGGWEVFWQRR